ncbi:unnamed protein product (macronuclear) [Paramecium tetraurelia]|uniref:Dynein light chain n=1 Tax=Paramecium tetraurelia TaxID=5888 RepID=A0D3S3_PARTE|nr:uncharacterized protein GSPATT00039243001 [Paramecium tetraurelia]CAK77690.1 unnamed protein product [Paramecium tetraurelia]|eukprot:XP_001445087.1 hypothetical protein (macronuclear) [Paramecium tetraurelia strain d4-2]
MTNDMILKIVSKLENKLKPQVRPNKLNLKIIQHFNKYIYFSAFNIKFYPNHLQVFHIFKNQILR